MRLVLGTGLGLNHFAHGPLTGLRFRAALVLLRLFAFAISMLFAVCHGMTLQRFRRHNAVSRLLEEHTTGGRFHADRLALILRPKAGRTSFLDQDYLLFVGDLVNMPEVLQAMLDPASWKMDRRSRVGN